MKKKRNQIKDELNAFKAKQREDEINTFGKMICHFNIVKSKRVYTRKRKHKNREEI